MKTRYKLLIVVLAAGVTAAGALIYIGPRFSLERRLETRLNSLKAVENTQLSLPTAPLLGRSDDDTFERADLAMDLTSDGVRYTSMELRLIAFYFYVNDQCPRSHRNLIGADRGEGETEIPEQDINSILSSSEFQKVDILEGRLRLMRDDGSTVEVEETAARIERNDIAGDISLEVPGHDDGLLIPLPEPLDGVKFREVRFVEGAIALRFSLNDPELFCA